MIDFSNTELRLKYHALNGLTHAFTMKEDGVWKLYFGDDNWSGFLQGTFPTRRAALKSASVNHPELKRYY